MKYHDMLSNDQRTYLTSQDEKVTNPSEQRSRISDKVDDIFNTLQIILKSNNIDQEFKDNLFTPHKVSYFISSLTEYDSENTVAQESNKQTIIIDLMQKVFSYYQSRYKETKFFSKEIEKFQQLAKDLEDLSRSEEMETEATIMYKTRILPTPPLVYPEKDNWVVECIFCFKYSTIGKNKEDSIKNIRHTKNCAFHKEMKHLGKKDKELVYIKFFRTFPPLNKT